MTIQKLISLSLILFSVGCKTSTNSSTKEITTDTNTEQSLAYVFYEFHGAIVQRSYGPDDRTAGEFIVGMRCPESVINGTAPRNSSSSCDDLVAVPKCFISNLNSNALPNTNDLSSWNKQQLVAMQVLLDKMPSLHNNRLIKCGQNDFNVKIQDVAKSLTPDFSNRSKFIFKNSNEMRAIVASEIDTAAINGLQTLLDNKIQTEKAAVEQKRQNDAYRDANKKVPPPCIEEGELCNSRMEASCCSMSKFGIYRLVCRPHALWPFAPTRCHRFFHGK